MNEQLLAVAKAIAKEILRLSKETLKKQGIRQDHRLFHSLESQMGQEGEDLVVGIIFSNYQRYLDGEATGATAVPLEAIKQWADRKSLSTNNEVLSAIYRALYRDGLQAEPMLAILEAEVEQYLLSGGYKEFEQILVDEIGRILESEI